MKDMDVISQYGKRALDILMMADPKATSLGLFAGILFHGLAALFNPVLSTIEIINIAAFRFWHYMAGGVLIFNLPGFFRRNKIDPKIEEALTYIKNQKNLGNIQEWQERQMYVNLHEKVLENITLEANAQEALRQMQRLSENTEIDE